MKLLSANHYWRICAAGLSYFLFAIGGFLPGIYIFFLALLPISKASKQRKVRNAIQALCRFYVNIMQFLGLMRFEFQDQHGAVIPKRRVSEIAGHMVISNHTMLIDALFVLGYVDNICCVVKASLCHNPFTSIPVKLAGYISNDHDDLVDVAKIKLDSGENILIFPEGTRNQADLQLDFKRGASNMAIISQAPILPLVICCMPRALGKGEKWYQLPTVKSKIVIQFHPVVRIEDCIDTAQPNTKQYRGLTVWLRDYYLKAVAKVVEKGGLHNSAR